MRATSAAIRGGRPPSPSPGDSAERRRLRQALQQAVEAGGFSLAFQPRRRLSDGVLLGAEAQLRWPRRRGGLAAAGDVLEMVDRSGLAPAVAAWSLSAACREARRWDDEPAEGTGRAVALAVPGWALGEGVLLQHVASALQESGLAPERLELAVAEGSLARDGRPGAVDWEDGVLALAALRDFGVGVALCGFGGRSADLLSLRRVPLTSLTLDRAMIREMPADPDAAAFVRAAAAAAHALGARVVAAGLETEAQRSMLYEQGCDAAQGPYFNATGSAN